MAKSREKQGSAKKPGAEEKETRYLYILTRVYIIFVISVMPLIVGTAGYDNIIFSKAQIYWAVTLVFLFVFTLFFLARILGRGKSADGAKWYKQFGAPDWAIVAFFVVITVSSILSPYQEWTWLGRRDRSDGWLTMFCMLACYYPVSRWYKPNRLDFSLYAASSAIFCAIGYLQFYGYDFMRLFPYNRSPYADAEGTPFFSGFSITFRSTIGNIDFVSAYVCMAVVAFGALYIKTKGPWRFLFLAASVMNFIMMIIGGADAGKVGVLGAMILLAPYWLSERESAGRTLVLSAGLGFSYALHHWLMINKIMPLWDDSAPRSDLIMRDNYSVLPLKAVLAASVLALAAGITVLIIKKWTNPKTAKILGLAATLVIIVCGLGVVETVGKNLPQENIIHQAREVMHGNIEDNFGSNRGYIWRNAIETAKSQPLFGTGQDTFMFALGEEVQTEAKELYGVMYDKAHNDFLQILLCNGILGLITYAAFVISLIALSVKPAFGDTVLLMAFAAVLAYLGQSMFGVDSITITPIFWLMAALTRNRQLSVSEVNTCLT